MKRFALLAGLALATLVCAQTAPPTAANADQQMAAALKEVQLQQAAIAEAQAKIDEKLVAVAEADSRGANLFQPFRQLGQRHENRHSLFTRSSPSA